MPQYQEGRLYPVTVNGQKTFARWGANVESEGNTVWTLPTGETFAPLDLVPTTGTPLFVIAVPDSDLPALITAAKGGGILGRFASQVVDQIPAPPTIPEPGWGEKVLASTADNPTRRAFVRVGTFPGTSQGHYYDAASLGYAWSELIAPVLP